MRKTVAERETGDPVTLGELLTAGKKVAPDVLNLLMEDHRVVLDWFEWFVKSHGMEYEHRIAQQICMALLAHMAAEEDFFYPEVEAATGETDLVAEAVEEHAKARETIAELQKAKEVDDEFRATMRTLWTDIAHHVGEEEDELFPKVRASSMDLYQVGRVLAARRVEVLFDQAGRLAKRGGKEARR